MDEGMSINTTERVEEIQRMDVEKKDFTFAHYVSYLGMMPVLFFIGVVSSVACLRVLSRPTFKSLHAKWYFQVLSVGDLGLFLTYIPIMVTLSGCKFEYYWFAWYFAHLGWTLASALHAFCTYVIAWLALDRCLAVWWHSAYKNVQRPRVQYWRAIITLICSFGVQITYMVDAEVLCTTPGGVEADLNCQNGTWLTVDGFQKSYDESWHEHFRRFHTSFGRWIPCALLTVFNLSLAVAVWQGKIHANAATCAGEGRKGARARTWERNLVATMIAMATSYLVLSLPITIYLTTYAEHVDDRCTTTYPAETLRHTANTLQFLQHVLHPFFLAALNPTFRRELMYMLRLRERGTYSGTGTMDGYSSDALTKGPHSVVPAGQQVRSVTPIKNGISNNAIFEGYHSSVTSLAP
ncbi:hypothetical protein Pcinc_016037 [Petrolisthes cinctipes]|uniref:G-protein coupled receptors family 1 profile domain-containing protein n=1 Tax=Petrolisthes cinctipes TaxID=88211 RepID=A0AAE1FS33_PETCI|nr:hypothetical protein Pcinc_032733 [Petrolisthes cinctipes]KAK3879390.1 hypothetical protein Pcinc_016037 [Petrolisthes cinctipes]